MFPSQSESALARVYVRVTGERIVLRPNARARRRGPVPQPRSGAPKAPDLTVAIAVAASIRGAIRRAQCITSIGATVPIGTSITPQIYTSLTDVTRRCRTYRAQVRLTKGLICVELRHSAVRTTFAQA
jgi:hypothetical protein